MQVDIQEGRQLNEKLVIKQLIISSVFFLIFIIIGSLQIMSTPFILVRGINLLVVIASSAVMGAIIREFFIVKEKKRNNN